MGSSTAKKLPALHAYKSNKSKGFQSTSSFLILERWELLLNDRGTFQATDASKPGNDELLSVQEQLERGLQEFQTLMLEEMMIREAPWEKEQLVQSNQLRIPLKGKPLQNEFVLLQTDDKGIISRGRMVSLYRISSDNEKHYNYHGNVTIRSLKGETLIQSTIKEGYITAFHERNSSASRQLLLKAPELPEVIVIAYVNRDNGISMSDWMLLQSFFSSGVGGTSGGSTGYYGSLSGNSGGGTPGGGSYGGGGGSYPSGGGSSGGSVTQDPPMEFEEEYIYDLPGIDINKIFKCFDNVPSNGATYTIKLCADLPSNSNPGASANFSAISGGHTFLTVTKTNGSVSVTQSFGFYPESMPSLLDPFGLVASTLKDNGVQEINASIEMNINESQFNKVKQNAIAFSSRKYELADYNCTDYALDIFNSARMNPIKVPPYKVILPGSAGAMTFNPAAEPIAVFIEKSPQMLFSTLRQMKNSYHAEASRILIDQSHNYRSPVSKGECN